MNNERIDTVVIGGGQAGLAAGYYLAKQKRDFLILDANDRIGDSWRRRWDSLRLFTPTGFNRLPGMPFPATRDGYPTKDQMADYLEVYAARFNLPVQLGARVVELARSDDRYLVRAGVQRLEANHVVVATGAYGTPRIPGIASKLDPTITQFHSVEYRNPGQLRKGPVLVVGAGNSGAEIARELAPTHPTWLAGRDTGSLPGAYGGFGYRAGGIAFITVAKLFTVDTLLGRWLIHKARAFTRGHPLVRIRPEDLAEAGVERVPRVAGVSRGLPVLEDRRVLEVANVIWSTGFRRNFRWIRLPVIDARGEPIHHRGVVQSEPGLYFTGLPFQSSLLSGHVAGAGGDAKHIVGQIARRTTVAGPAYEGKLAGKQHQDYRDLQAE
jgi:putative flavoprotein involved in K+ transport